MRRFLLVSLIAFAAGTAAVTARADELQYDQVEFTVQAETELQNDLAEAVLAAEAQHTDPAQVAAEINRAMGWALQQARAAKAVEAESGGYETYPVYDKTRLIDWRGSQGLVLRSRDSAALNALLGTLQQRLQVKAMRFTVSPERQRAAEVRLVDQALEDFKTRAARIQQGLGAKGYRIVRLQVDGAAAPPMPLMARVAAMEQDAAAPVAAEPGSSRQRLGVHAVIQLQF